MVLLNRKPWRPAAAPEGLSPDEEVFHIEETGEVFRSYEAFLQKKDLYQQTVWSCKYSGKGGMTLLEALEAEKKALAALAAFPVDLEEQVCRAVHHSMARVEELVGSIYESLRPTLAEAGAQTAQKEQQQKGAAQGEQQPSPFGSKENKPQQGAAGGAAAGGAAHKAEDHAEQADSGAAAGAGGGGAAGAEPSTAKKAEAAGGAAGAGEQRSGRKAKTPKAPVSRSLLRTYIIENAEQQGPEHATKQAWVVKPELRQRFGLPEELPADVQEKLNASVKAPKKPKKQLDAPKGLGLGTKLPSKKKGSKKEAKKAAAAAAGSPSGSKPAAAGAGEKIAEKEKKAEKDKGPMVPVKAKSLEEVEKQYMEGTLKHAMVQALKAVQPEALTVQGIADKAKELGIREFEDKEKSKLANALTSDPNFLRLSKGAYSLHCFHPDKEQLVKAPQPKEPKQSKKGEAAVAAGATPVTKKAAAAAAEGTAQKEEKEAVPMVRVEAKSLEEVEKQYKEGTLKQALVQVLKAVQPEALTVPGILEKGKEMGLELLVEKHKGIAHALTSDPNFLRLSKGAYSLHCFHPDKEQLVKAPQPKEPKQSKRAAAAGAAEEGSGEGATPAAGDKAEQKEAVPMVRVEAKSLEEVEAQYKEGTLKHAVVQVLKAVQPEALTMQGIVDKAKEMGLEMLAEKAKSIGQAVASDPNFLRLSKGAYSLHCFHPDKEQLVKAPQPKKRKLADFADLEEGEAEGSKVAKQEGSAAGGEEVDSITKAEQHVKLTKRALAMHRAALEKAQAECDAAKAAFEADKKQAKKATPAKERLSDIHIPAEQLARFEVPEEEREFKGESDDRKGLLEFRQNLQKRVKELEKAKKAFLEGERAKRDKQAKEGSKESKAFELALRRAEKALEHERRSTESAEKAAAAAEKKLEKEKERAVKGEERAKEKEEREKQKLVEREERERRRAEAAKAKEEAKRYPMEDLELLEELRQKAADTGEAAPDEDVEQPNWLSREDSQRLSTALYVADFVTQFSKQLGCKALTYDHLEAALADATSGGANIDEDYNAGTLHTLYERLIRDILEDLRAEEEASAQEKRWLTLLSEGTWPEVLRRLVLTRAAEADAEEQPSLRPDPQALMGASMLAFDCVDSLTHDQHLALLRFLCDSLLDSEKMRAVLQKREDEAQDVKRDVREELAEQRKALKELLDSEKEERKRKREERRKAEEEEKAAADAAAVAAAAAEGEGQQREQQAPQQVAQAAQQDGQKPMEVDGQEEPSFELPERLREYTGPPDKKALMQWRQEQQAEKRRLEKERNRWVADQLRRQRELEAQEKAAREVEKAKQREKEEKEEAICRAQEALEEKLEKYSVRRAPLGTDRHHRRYWWGLAAHRPVVWVEDAEGRWGSLSSLTELDGLLASLDRRGVRELALAEGIEKRFQAIAVAMQRAERAAAAGGTKGKVERAEPTRRSGRQTQQVDFFDPAKASKGAGAATTGLAALFGPAECAAVEATAEEMTGLQKSAGSLLSPPEACGSWKEWAAAVTAAAAGSPAAAGGSKAAAGGSKKPSAAAVRSALQSCLLQLEEVLLDQSVGGLAAAGATSEEMGSEEAGERQDSGEGDESSPGSDGGRSREQSVEVLDVVDELFSPTKRPDVTYLWKTQRERSAWQTDLKQAATAARIAYCAAVLAQQAGPMLATLRKTAGAGSGGGKKGKGSGGTKAAAGEARGSGKAAAAAAAASSRPVSRTNSAAALEAAAAGGSKAGGSGGGKGGKRKAPPAPLPENARLTRSRH